MVFLPAIAVFLKDHAILCLSHKTTSNLVAGCMNSLFSVRKDKKSHSRKVHPLERVKLFSGFRNIWLTVLEVTVRLLPMLILLDGFKCVYFSERVLYALCPLLT